MPQRVTAEVHAGVADVRLNRPEKRNALDLAMLDALIDAGLALAGDGSLRAVVLSGEGPSFCSGLDVSLFAELLGKDAADTRLESVPALARRPGETASVAQQAVDVWRRLPVPVIAAVHGHTLGGGLQLALGADLRLVAPDAQLSVLEIRWGLIPDMTGTMLLPGLVGPDVAKELTWTGRLVRGDEAVRLGLATRLSETPRDDALHLAAAIAANSPSAVRASKALLEGAEAGRFEEGLVAEQHAQRRLIGTVEQVEAVTSYFEKRPPHFGR